MKAMAGIRTDHLTHQALTSAFRATGDLRQGLLPYTEYSQIKAVSIWKKKKKQNLNYPRALLQKGQESTGNPRKADKTLHAAGLEITKAHKDATKEYRQTCQRAET